MTEDLKQILLHFRVDNLNNSYNYLSPGSARYLLERSPRSVCQNAGPLITRVSLQGHEGAQGTYYRTLEIITATVSLDTEAIRVGVTEIMSRALE